MTELKQVCKSVNFILVPKRELTASEVLGITFLKRAFPNLECTFSKKETPQLDLEKIFNKFKEQGIGHILWHSLLRDSFEYIYDDFFCSTLETSFISKIDHDDAYRPQNVNLFFKFVDVYNIFYDSGGYNLEVLDTLIEASACLFDSAVTVASHLPQ